jgi:hypothetical protein
MVDRPRNSLGYGHDPHLRLSPRQHSRSYGSRQLPSGARLAVGYDHHGFAALPKGGKMEFSFPWPMSQGEWLAWGTAALTVFFGVVLLFAPRIAFKLLRLQTNT